LKDLSYRWQGSQEKMAQKLKFERRHPEGCAIQI
jgi:hypothetical protein